MTAGTTPPNLWRVPVAVASRQTRWSDRLAGVPLLRLFGVFCRHRHHRCRQSRGPRPNRRHSAIGHGLWLHVDSMRRRLLGVLLFLVASTSACKTDEAIAIHSVKINGAHAVDPSLLRA